MAKILQDVNLIMARFLSLLARLITERRSLKVGLLISIVVTGPFLAQAFLPHRQGENKTLPHPGTIAPNSQPITSAPSINTAPPIFKLRDEFNYNSTKTMIAAGWSECSNAPPSYTQISGGIVTLQNDGNVGAALCWTNIPRLVHDWNITARIAWTSNSSIPPDAHGTLHLGALTTSHFYVFGADGTDNYYHEYVDSVSVGLATTRYTPILNAWRILSLAMSNHTLSMSIDGKIVLILSSTNEDTDLTMIHLSSGWETTDSYDYVTANQILPTTPDFLVYPSPFSQTVSYGTTATVTISLYSINNFNNQVFIGIAGSNATGAPTTILNPSSVRLSPNGTGTSTLTVPTTSLVSTQVSITITASSGSLSHQATVSLSTTPPPPEQDFAITASPTNLTLVFPNVGPMPSANFTITITSLNGFNGTVTLQAGFSWNPGFSLSLSRTIIHLTPNGNTTVILTVFDPRLSANAFVNVTGMSIVGSRYATVQVTFDSASFRIVATRSTILVKAGTSAVVMLTIYSNSFYGTLNLNAQVFPSYAGSPSVSISPSSVILTGSGSVRATMTISAGYNANVGESTVTVTGNNYLSGSATVNVIVSTIDRLPGVTPGMRASYSLSISSYTRASLGLVTTVTSVDGSNVTYRTDFLVDGYTTNSTMSWIDLATGETSMPVLLPLPFVATSLNVGDAVYLGGAFSSLTIASKAIVLLLGAHRLSITAHRSSPSGTFDSTWDASTGILYSIDATIPLNSTYVSIHYRLLETNVWAKLTTGFSQSPTIGPAPLTVDFTSNSAGGQVPYTYDWNFGDGVASTLPNPTHLFAVPGNYTVSLTVTDSAGDIIFSSASVTVSSPSLTPSLPQNMYQMIIEFVISNYIPILAGLGGIWVTLAGLAVFLATKPKRKTAT